MQTNANAATYFATQDADRLAHLWVLTCQIKEGRSWGTSTQGFLTYDAAVLKQTYLERIYRHHVRAFKIEPIYLHG